ncbi:MAG: HIT domain-containing protein [Deltaproteobacteria bacterium]|nr:HIT domain-containing protein [Deltaproteobacteria bacterium]
MSGFSIHPQLLSDCHLIGKFDFCWLLLHKNSALPWFILVPQTEVSDLLDLPPALRTTAMNEAARLSGFIKKTLAYPKINFAAIGNVVPQLHLHVVGRTPGDACWPAPVWGHLGDASEYSQTRIAEIRALLVDHCGLMQL